MTVEERGSPINPQSSDPLHGHDKSNHGFLTKKRTLSSVALYLIMLMYRYVGPTQFPQNLNGYMADILHIAERRLVGEGSG